MTIVALRRASFRPTTEIAQRAYEMFLDRESSSDGFTSYWDAAETELLERAVARALSGFRRKSQGDRQRGRRDRQPPP